MSLSSPCPICSQRPVMAGSHSASVSLDSVKALDIETKEAASIEQFDPVAYYENNAGRLVIDPECVCSILATKHSTHRRNDYREARIEFGDAVAKTLKLSSDGTTVLWPQPTDDPEDPQNVLTFTTAGNRHRLISLYSGLVVGRGFSS